jgi:phospholipid transport system transporter-binding protein
VSVSNDIGRPRFDGGERWSVNGAITIDSAGELLAASRAAPLPSSGVVALHGVGTADSSAVAVLLAWRRRADSERRRLDFAGVPDGVAALARLYGVEQLIFSGADATPAHPA